jgi:hypothetical protein
MSHSFREMLNVTATVISTYLDLQKQFGNLQQPHSQTNP